MFGRNKKGRTQERMATLRTPNPDLMYEIKAGALYMAASFGSTGRSDRW